jgi:hypothetical protein
MTVFGTLLVIGLAVWFHFADKFGYVMLHRPAEIYVDGQRVGGDYLGARASALLTIRKPGPRRTYMLGFAGDIDMTGNIGSARLCYGWIAPRLPVLFIVGHYPSCPQAPNMGHRRSCADSGIYEKGNGGLQFTAEDGSHIVVQKPLH